MTELEHFCVALQSGIWSFEQYVGNPASKRERLLWSSDTKDCRIVSLMKTRVRFSSDLDFLIII